MCSWRNAADTKHDDVDQGHASHDPDDADDADAFDHHDHEGEDVDASEHGSKKEPAPPSPGPISKVPGERKHEKTSIATDCHFGYMQRHTRNRCKSLAKTLRPDIDWGRWIHRSKLF